MSHQRSGNRYWPVGKKITQDQFVLQTTAAGYVTMVSYTRADQLRLSTFR